MRDICFLLFFLPLPAARCVASRWYHSLVTVRGTYPPSAYGPAASYAALVDGAALVGPTGRAKRCRVRSSVAAPRRLHRYAAAWTGTARAGSPMVPTTAALATRPSLGPTPAGWARRGRGRVAVVAGGPCAQGRGRGWLGPTQVGWLRSCIVVPACLARGLAGQAAKPSIRFRRFEIVQPNNQYDRASGRPSGPSSSRPRP